MGTWGYLPWENDSAADWYGDTFEETGLADRVEKTLKLPIADSAEEIRAAAAILLLLGHTFVWPVDDLDRHLALAADRLSEIKQSGMYEESPEIQTLIDAEVQELRSRMKKTPPPGLMPPNAEPSESTKRWWEFWK